LNPIRETGCANDRDSSVSLLHRPRKRAVRIRINLIAHEGIDYYFIFNSLTYRRWGDDLESLEAFRQKGGIQQLIR
jgi:hypothetical protein